MLNNESLEVFEKKLAQKAKSQFVKLDEDIESGKRRAAAKGLAMSGAMIKEVMGLCINFTRIKGRLYSLKYWMAFRSDIHLT